MQYPTSRPQFYMNAFVKAMRDNQVSMTFGDDAYRLLIAVVCREDDTGYKRAVQFHNIPLMYEAGIRSEDSLARARKKLVEAGWLVFVSGTKRGPGTYFVCVPDDAIVATKQQIQPVKTEPVAASVPDSCGLSAGYGAVNVRVITGDSCGQLAEPSSHSHSQSQRVRQSPSETGAAPLAPPTANLFDDDLSDKTATKTPAKVRKSRAKPQKESDGKQALAVEGFRERWKAKYGEDYLFKYDSEGANVKQMLEFLGRDLDKFFTICDRYFADDDGYRAAQSRHSVGNLLSKFNVWNASPVLETVPKPSKFKTREQVVTDRFVNHAASILEDFQPTRPIPETVPLALN